MTLDFTKAKWSTDQDGTWMSLLVTAPRKAREFCGSMEDKTYTASIEKKKKGRSLDQNSYFWLLCGKLAAKIGLPKQDIYREYIKDIGDNFEIIPVREAAKDKWIEIWEAHGIGWVCDDLGTSKLKGYTNIMCYYGSSTYDSTQMTRLVNLVVEDCKLQNIETLTPDELALLEEA